MKDSDRPKNGNGNPKSSSGWLKNVNEKGMSCCNR